ncbi:MAG TPA: penicillin acylase family protein [Burkholderiales bacterium]|nr:penicillin acylase family protein [Burkholderiales bacterium]
MKRIFALAVALLFSNAASSQDANAGPAQRLAGLQDAARVTIDNEGISHVRAHNDHDLYFMQGWVHAGDRLFQMDYNRRLASGTLGELVGTAALPTDVQLRTLGLRRSAQRSYDAASPFFRAALDAYAQGVNARLATLTATTLPPEYGALQLRQVAPWAPVDSIVIGKLLAFSLAFELDIDRTVALQSYIAAFGPARGTALYSQDLWRSAAFEPNATVPDAMLAPPSSAGLSHGQRGMERAQEGLHGDDHMSLMREYLEHVRDLPAFQGVLKHEARGNSNLWAVSGSLTQDGRPLLANDPHLAVATPSVFYPMGLENDGEPVFGSSVAGTPGIIHGYNRWIAWGSTNNLVDVTDVFAEQVVPVPLTVSPSGFATLYKGALEPVMAIPETFRANVGGSIVIIAPTPTNGIPPATLIVPRRDGGPIISLNRTTGAALSVQYVGNGPTQELEAFLLMNRARNVDDFKAALQHFDVGSQNFVYIDAHGNIAYFTSGEIPVREDLQAGTVNGVPPWFVRNGQGGNEWLPVSNRQPYQASAFEVLPFSELPQIVNPPAGYFVNANNDPSGVTRDNNPLNQLRPGGGISYTAYSWKAGFRVARIEKRLREYFESGDRRVSFKEMQAIQADVVVHDGEVFTPYIVAAFDRALASAEPQLRALAADTGIAEAVARLRRWDGSTPTGITQGYDAADVAGALQPPSASEVQASAAAAIYAAWRSRMLGTVVNGTLGPLPAPDDFDSLAALRNLLDNFKVNGGIGASGVNFFAVPGIAAAADRRDFVILSSLRAGLDMLASPAFFASTSQDDYRWGRLHRIEFTHPLGSVFSIPPAGGAFPAPLPGVRGIPTDGGFQTVDASSHNARGKAPDDFMFTVIPSHRMVAEAGRDGMRAADIWPGGTSGVLGNPNYAQFLTRWLADDSIPLHLANDEVVRSAAAVEKYVPAD